LVPVDEDMEIITSSDLFDVTDTENALPSDSINNSTYALNQSLTMCTSSNEGMHIKDPPMADSTLLSSPPLQTEDINDHHFSFSKKKRLTL